MNTFVPTWFLFRVNVYLCNQFRHFNAQNYIPVKYTSKVLRIKKNICQITLKRKKKRKKIETGHGLGKHWHFLQTFTIEKTAVTGLKNFRKKSTLIFGFFLTKEYTC